MHHTPQAGLNLALWKIEEPEVFFTQPAARQITHPHKRIQHLAARHLLHSLWPPINWNEIYLLPGAKPLLPPGQAAFSVSHCGDYAAAIVQQQGGSAGIDVEVISSRLENIRNKFLHPSEQRFVNSQDPSVRSMLLTIMWSAKESMFKWWGRGGVDFSEVLRIMPFAAVPSGGQIQAAFLHPMYETSLLISYRILPEEQLVISWVSTPKHP